MMTYLLLDVVFVGLALMLSHLMLGRLQTPNWKFVGLLLLATIIFDTYLTRQPIVLYASAKHLPLKFGSIPIEDFAYAIAAMFFVPAVFEMMRRRHGSDSQD